MFSFLLSTISLSTQDFVFNMNVTMYLLSRGYPMKTLNMGECQEVGGGFGFELFTLSAEVLSVGIMLLSQIGQHVLPAVLSVVTDMLSSASSDKKDR